MARTPPTDDVGDARAASSGGSSDEAERRAWGWVAGLRAGSNVGWTAWRELGEPGGRHLPGAQQLELLRRLNDAAGGVPAREGLTTRVLEASAPGRGRPDLQLLGVPPPSASGVQFGPAPVDPAALGDDELVRLATGLIADDLVAAGPPDPPHARIRPWHPAREIGGDAWLAPWLRDELTARGRPPGRPRAAAYVVGGDLATLVAHAWTARALDEGGGAWREWLRGFVRTDRTPPRADLAGHARFWAERVGRRRTHVVADPALAPRLLHARRLAPAPRLGAHATELARRVAAPLGLLVLPEQRAALLRGRLAPRLAALAAQRPDAETAPLAVPVEWHPWLAERAERAEQELTRAGYPVHGDLGVLRRVPEGGTVPDDAAVLDLALALLLEPGVEPGAEPGARCREGSWEPPVSRP